MIKKINILLILVGSLCSLFIAIAKENSLVLVFKDISVILTMSSLYIIQKIFKIKINEYLNFIFVLFIFIAHFLGVVVDLYSKIYWFDKFTHFLSGVLTSFIAIYLLVKCNIKGKTLFNILFIIAFTMMIAGLWEIFEYTSSCLFNLDPQRVLQTGVSDTMGDIIVALLGSIIVSLAYYFEYKYNYNIVIKKFIKLI